MDVEGGAEDDGVVDVSGGDEVDEGIGSEEGGAAWSRTRSAEKPIYM